MWQKLGANIDPQTFIAFLSLSSVFIILALIVTPLVEFYMPPSITHNELNYVTRHRRRRHGRGQMRVHGMREIENGDGAPGVVRYECQSACVQSINRAYAGQYIVGISYIIVGFIKWKQLSTHLARLLLALSAMNLSMAHPVFFERHRSLQGFANALRRWRVAFFSPAPSGGHVQHDDEEDKDKKGSDIEVADLSFLVNQLLFCILFALTINKVAKDEAYRTCVSTPFSLIVDGIWTLCLPWIFIRPRGRNYQRNPLRRVGLSLAVILLIVYEAVVFQRTKKKFPGSPTADTSVAAQFSIGQILILTMIVPLLVDYTNALGSESTLSIIIPNTLRADIFKPISSSSEASQR